MLVLCLLVAQLGAANFPVEGKSLKHVRLLAEHQVIDDGASEAGQSQVGRHRPAGVTLFVAQSVRLRDGVRFGQSVNLIPGLGHLIAERFRRKRGCRAEENLLGAVARVGVFAARDSIDLDTERYRFEGLREIARCLKEQTRLTLVLDVFAEETIVLASCRLAFNLGAFLEDYIDGSEIDETYAYHHVALFAVEDLLRRQTDGINEDFQHVQLLPGRLGLLPLF